MNYADSLQGEHEIIEHTYRNTEIISLSEMKTEKEEFVG